MAERKLKRMSVVLTVHNKEQLLPHVLVALRETISIPFELIVVLDGCDDKSEEIANSQSVYFDRCKIIHTPDVFETKANNAGLKECENDIVAIIQDDIVMKEYGWEQKLWTPFYLWNDVFAMSGNCSHDWLYNKNSKHIHEDFHRSDAWCDILNHVNHYNKKKKVKGVVGIRDSCNRGPLMLDLPCVRALKYFDEEFAPQDMDDHDLCYRAWDYFGKVAGCYPVHFVEKPEWGGTRVDGRPAPWLLRANNKNMRIVWDRHNKYITGPKHSENRQI